MFDLSVFYFVEEGEERSVFVGVGIWALAYFFRIAATVEKLLFIHLERKLTLYILAGYFAETDTLNNSFVEISSQLFDVDQSANNSIL